jgi:hypothetical protein
LATDFNLNETISTRIPLNLSSGNYLIRVINSNNEISENTFTLLVNAKPIISTINGSNNPQINSVQNYSVTNTIGSIYYWSVLGGVQTSGGNTNTIQVTWGNQMTLGNVKVIQLDANGCYSDTVYKNLVNVLPVSWLNFEGEFWDQNNVLLNWSTSSEINNKAFEIERLNEHGYFEKIGTVIGKGNSNVINNYNFNDSKVFISNCYYYRLKQIDFDGKYSISKTIKVFSKNKEDFNIKIFPNPACTSLLVTGYLGEVMVYDMEGNLLIKTDNNSLIDISKLQEGFYLLKVQNNIVKFIKKGE